jgi:hypothetical protein
VNTLEYSDSKDARCNGLRHNVAKTFPELEYVDAHAVTKDDGPFFCPLCFSDVIVRKCSDKIDHFAHKANYTPIPLGRNTQLHHSCRDTINDILCKQYPEGKWATEREIPAKGKQRAVIPDISGRIDGKPIAIEVQRSPYTLPKIVEKLKIYSALNIHVLWVIPLTRKLPIEEFRPRLFELFLHKFCYGRVYYWEPDSPDLLKAVHYSPAARYIESSTWFDKDAMAERSEGGYYLTYKTIKKPNIGGILDISKDFTFGSIKEQISKTKSPNVPQSLLFKDKLKRWWPVNEKQKLLADLEEAQKDYYKRFNAQSPQENVDEYDWDDED